jgi:uncharacterized protein (DUF1501 family)
MNDFLSRELSRRKFIGNCCAAVSATGMLSALAQLRVLGALANSANTVSSGSAPSDYRALVCLFLLGGNDANNLIIPNDTAGYATYASGRTSLALPQSSLLGINPRTTDGRAWGLHPATGPLKALFDSGQLALLGNVGTLVVPTNKSQYQAGSVPLPMQLFSHNDQQIEWQSSVPDKPFTTGWGGRLADLTNAFNSNNRISMAISLNGQNSFQVGQNVVQYAVNTNGAVALSGSSSSTTSAAGIRTKAQADVLNSPNASLFDTAFGGMTSQAVSDSALLASALSGATNLATVFPTSSLGQQMKMIARLISVRSQLGLNRQVFFARVSGWDLHDNQLTAADPSMGAHANLLSDLSTSMKAFYDSTVELGVANQVTTFTASDFGRTLKSNGDGSDHGWGSHHLVMGGAVKGGDLYGTMPDLTISGPNDTGSGRWIPTTSVDEYSATLASWFGVSNSDLATVLPNIGRFAHPNLGFMG